MRPVRQNPLKIRTATKVCVLAFLTTPFKVFDLREKLLSSRNNLKIGFSEILHVSTLVLTVSLSPMAFQPRHRPSTFHALFCRFRPDTEKHLGDLIFILVAPSLEVTSGQANG